ncbi:MAG TPA: glycosyltransferase [Vicinamibacterales bacterium]|nr:glycosyltransferase [Vicinamibacterales bacterium]
MSRDPANQATRRVARVITRLNIGGPSIQATRLTSALEAHGFTTTLLHGRLGEGEGDMSYLIPPDADARYVSALRRPLAPLDDLRAFLRIYRVLREVQPHIVHTHMAKAGLLARLAATAYNISRGSAPRARIVHTYHGHVLDGYFSPVATKIFITLERLLARLTDRLVAISPAIRSELLQTYRIGRDRQYRVVALGFDLSPFAAVDAAARAAARHSLGLPADAAVVTTVGRLTAIKQHGLFLDTVARVRRSHPNLIAVIAGDGELRAELESKAAALGIDDSVRMLGWRRDLATIYAATDVFLLTSRNEGTPVALIEAMAAGVPGVSTDVGGVTDVIGGADTGRTAPFGDADALARAIEELLADPQRRAAMGAAARARVLAHYDLNRLVADVAALYRDMLADS